MHASGNDLYPLLFYPVYKDYLWGGDEIARRYARDVPRGVCAESWEVSGHPDGISVVANGRLEGTRLDRLVEAHGPTLLGHRAGSGPFPLLLKLIDAKKRLSVQVHPNDDAAARYGGQAKTEMWYLLDAEPGAVVFAGLRPGVDADTFRRAVEDESFEGILRTVPVSAGDAVFIPGGRVHAIDKGCLILEIQQSSNTTYRIYDWGRVDADGRPRDLHIEQAVQVAAFDDQDDAKVRPRLKDDAAGRRRWEVFESAYFRMERWEVDGAIVVPGDPATFQILFCAAGHALIEWHDDAIDLPAGTSCLVPACLPEFRLRPTGAADLLRITVPADIS